MFKAIRMEERLQKPAVNCNDITTTGYYHIPANQLTTNSPTNLEGLLIVYSTGTFIMQIFKRTDSDYIYERNCVENTWYEWRTYRGNNYTKTETDEKFQPKTAMIDYATNSTLTNSINTHNTDSSAHADIRQKFNSYLPLTGGTVTGTLNVQTQDTADNSTKVANTAFVQSAVSQLVNSAPETLDTLNELANALGDDPNFATTVSTQIGEKADKTELNSKIELHNTDSTAHQPILDMINTNQTALTGTDDQLKSVLNTLLGTGAWDTPATNSIANIINLVGLGGIVAQRLESNGYIKFANRFAIQWGIRNDITPNPGVPVVFPVEFSMLMGISATARNRVTNTFKHTLIVSNYSNTQFNVMNDDVYTSSCFWMAIGLI